MPDNLSVRFIPAKGGKLRPIPKDKKPKRDDKPLEVIKFVRDKK